MGLKFHSLTKKEAQEISDYYGLGKVLSVELFARGLVNLNYKLNTEKGFYVIRFFGKALDEWKKEMAKLEREVLFHLKKKNFPYEIPVPLSNKNKKYLSIISGKYYWVYEMIKGRSLKKLNDEQFKELGKATAIYYKYIKNFKIKVKKIDFSLEWFKHKYKEMENKLSKMKNPDKTDKLVMNNFEFFKELLYKLDKINFKTNMIVAHGDLQKANVLYRKNKLVGIIDFDNLKIAPRAEDVAYALRLGTLEKNGLDKKRTKLFMKEYEKYVKLTEKEKSMINPLILRANVIVFWWMYMEMKKGQDKKYAMMKWTVDVTKALAKEWK